MNKQLASLLVTLLIVPFGAVSAAADSDKVTEPQVTPTDLQPAPAANNDNKAPEKAEIEKAAAADKAVDKAVEPITGAFGIPLGEHFEASMVAKVLSKQEHSYKAQGTTKLKGQLLRIEPVKPDDRFQQYSLKTTDEGIIYAIQGDYQYKAESDKAMPDEANQDEARPDEAMQVEAMQVEAKAKAKAKGSGKGAGKPGNRQPANAMQLTCKAAVKTLAKELEARYGKPRGQGWDGLWYTFRQFSDTANKGVKLYGHRCRTGMYSIIYTDNKVQRAMQSGKAKSSAEAGTPATGNAPKQP